MDNRFALIQQQFTNQTPSIPNVCGASSPQNGHPHHQTKGTSPGVEKDDKKAKAKRLGRACGACRKRKVRCSGDKPVCANCLRLNSPCVYAPSTKGKAPRSGYNEMLQKRLDKMEKLLQPPKQDGFTEEIWKSLTTVPESETDLLSDGEHYVSPQHSPRVRGIKRTADGETKHPWDDTQPSFPPQSPPAAMPLESRAGGADEDDEENYIPNIPLPPLHIQEHLAETYFANCHVPYTVLHKPSFMKQVVEGTVPPALILSVCAVSARFSRHPEVRQHPMSTAGDEYAADARRLLCFEFDRPTLSNVQSLVILGLHEFGSSRGVKAWMYAGIAIRMAISLGLNVEDEARSASQSWIECEIRRRAFWATFIMDRFSSSSYVQAPHFLREKDVQIQLPCSDYEFVNEIPVVTEMLNGEYHPSVMKFPGTQIGNLDPCAYFIRMTSTWGRVISYVNDPRDRPCPPWDPDSDFTRLDQELHDMHSSLPQLYIYTKNNLSAAIAENRAYSLIFLHITIRHSLYFLHRWIFPGKITPQPTSMYVDAPPDFMQTSARKCIASANAISLILAHVQEMNTLLLVPFMGFCAYTTAILHVSNAFSPNPEISRTAKRHLATNLRILTVMRKHWTITEQWCQGVRELYEQQQNFATSRRGSFIQFKDDVPNQYDKQSFLFPTSNGSQHSSSPSRGGSVQQASQSSVVMFADILQPPQSTYQFENPPTNAQLLYPPTAEITSKARRKAEEERAILEAMTQSASLPVSPYLGPTGFPNWISMPFTMNDPGDEGFQFGRPPPMGYGMQMEGNGSGEGLTMEELPSLDEIINSVEGMDVAGIDAGFGLLDDMGLFDVPLPY